MTTRRRRQAKDLKLARKKAKYVRGLNPHSYSDLFEVVKKNWGHPISPRELLEPILSGKISRAAEEAQVSFLEADDNRAGNFSPSLIRIVTDHTYAGAEKRKEREDRALEFIRRFRNSLNDAETKGAKRQDIVYFFDAPVTGEVLALESSFGSSYDCNAYVGDADDHTSFVVKNRQGRSIGVNYSATHLAERLLQETNYDENQHIHVVQEPKIPHNINGNGDQEWANAFSSIQKDEWEATCYIFRALYNKNSKVVNPIGIYVSDSLEALFTRSGKSEAKDRRKNMLALMVPYSN